MSKIRRAPDRAPTKADEAIDPVSRFEASLSELETIVAGMERGELPLEQSLALFERGVQLSRDCRSALEQAELRVKTLLENGGESTTSPTEIP